MASGFFLMNFRDFEQKFKVIVESTIPALIKKGYFKAGAVLIRYAIYQEPRAPHKTGTLWRSQSIQPLEEREKFGVTVGFNVSYAARLHEWLGNEQWGEVVHWTLKGSGPKFLSTKLVWHNDELLKIVADYVTENAGRFGG